MANDDRRDRLQSAYNGLCGVEHEMGESGRVPTTGRGGRGEAAVGARSDSRPQTWYTRYGDSPWGVHCATCGVLGSGLDKMLALKEADRHAREIHGVKQPLSIQHHVKP